MLSRALFCVRTCRRRDPRARGLARRMGVLTLPDAQLGDIGPLGGNRISGDRTGGCCAAKFVVGSACDAMLGTLAHSLSAAHFSGAQPNSFDNMIPSSGKSLASDRCPSGACGSAEKWAVNACLGQFPA